jgi:hypothetical protein
MVLTMLVILKYTILFIFLTFHGFLKWQIILEDLGITKPFLYQRFTFVKLNNTVQVKSRVLEFLQIFLLIYKLFKIVLLNNVFFIDFRATMLLLSNHSRRYLNHV